MKAHENLMRFSWAFQKLMRFRQISWVFFVSFFAHEIFNILMSFQKLVRFSWAFQNPHDNLVSFFANFRNFLSFSKTLEPEGFYLLTCVNPQMLEFPAVLLPGTFSKGCNRRASHNCNTFDNIIYDENRSAIRYSSSFQAFQAEKRFSDTTGTWKDLDYNHHVSTRIWRFLAKRICWILRSNCKL